MIKGELPPEGEMAPPPARSVHPMSLDQMSKRIIESLQDDGRRPISSIATEIGMPEESVAERVRELTDSHVIKIVGVSDARRLGFTRQGIVGLHVERGTAEGVGQRLSELPEVVYLMSTNGPYDVLAELFTTSEEHFEKTVAAIRALPFVLRARPYPYVRVRKQTYCWSVR